MSLKERLAIAALISILLGGCDLRPQQWSLRGLTMGTSYEIKLEKPLEGERAEKLRLDVAEILERVDKRMSTWREDSELSRFNRAASNVWFPVSVETAEVARRALEISRRSDGFFDVSVGPLLALWGFGAQGQESPPSPPARSARESACARVGWRKWRVRRDPPALIKNVASNLDFSAIAKGYAVDQIAQLLEAAGIDGYLVEIGGELRAAGHSGRGRPWRIGIVDPSSPARDARRAIVIRRPTAVATSGDYNLYYERDGRRYSHTIDPRRCSPAHHRLASVTVIARSAAEADALATAMHAMGEAQGLRFAERENIAAYFLVRVGSGEEERLQERASLAFTPYLALE